VVTAYIGIGSNLGNRQENIDKAVSYLEASKDIELIRKSSMYETEPEGAPLGQGKYLNGVIEIKTGFIPLDLLRLLNEIEAKLGRKRLIKNGPRTIDLDILLYGDLKIEEKDLIIPHPRMHRRDFVLRPLREIAPDRL